MKVAANARKAYRMRYLAPVTVIMILVVFILPFFSAPGYTIWRNTTSHMGAQGSPHAWVMNLVFILLGISVIAECWPRLTVIPQRWSSMPTCGGL